MNTQAPLPLPDELPDELKAAIASYVPFDTEPDELIDRLVTWFDGRHPDEFLKCLDALRSRQAYPLSLGLLEAAWNSDLSDDQLGHIAEDWIGTVLHGLGDRKGAAEVAAHIARDAERHGPAFANDLAHLLLGWDMHDAARPLVEFAARELPGDLTAQFNLGVSRKLQGDWESARDAFALVLHHRQDDKAALWNLGIAHTGLGDWDAARRCWTALGFRLPSVDGDYGAEGDLTPIRLASASGRYEVLWGNRLCPARVRLKGIPVSIHWAGFGDDLIIDGVTAGEVSYDGRQMPVYTTLGVSKRSGRRRYGIQPAGPVDSSAIDRMIQYMDHHGFAYADWRVLGDRHPYPVAIAPMNEAELGEWSNALENAGLLVGRWVPLDGNT